MLVKVPERTNEKVTGQLAQFPYFTLKCKLSEVLKNRGLTMKELSALTGIRIAALSEMNNLKRSSVNIPHLVVIAQVLRIDEISDLFEFVMPDDTKEVFERDKAIIEKSGVLPEQEEFLSIIRKDKKKKPTSN
ncbi:helix-turn-helix domain-containing protein [Bacillus licheniformis]|uniref:helix-turn-helix domain-containing protein n=1 Tax=Bacillus licheniformis TaxID=1402 RepID=UPI0031F5D319